MAMRLPVVPERWVGLMSDADRKACGVCTAAERKAASVARRERALQRDCESYLRRIGIEYLHLSPRAREKIGWPDLVFAVRGVRWAVELKVPGGRLTDAQARRLEALERNGWHVAVCWSYEEFVNTINTGQASGIQPPSWP